MIARTHRVLVARAVLEVLVCVAIALEHLAARADGAAYLVMRWGGLEPEPDLEEVQRARAWTSGEDADG